MAIASGIPASPPPASDIEHAQRPLAGKFIEYRCHASESSRW